MSPDPFDLLRDELTAAEARAATATRPRRTHGRRPLIAVIAALALSGTAAAAVLTLAGGEPSAPLEGRVPGVDPGARGVSRYAITIAPDLRAGVAGWCSTVTFRGRRATDSGGVGGCGPALSGREPQIAGGGLTIAARRLLTYRVVDRRVAFVRLPDGRRLVPRADPRLPFGWRGVVGFTPYARGKLNARLFEVGLFDAQGRPLASSGRDSVPDLPTTRVDARRPPARPCAIRPLATPHLSGGRQKLVSGPLAATADVNGRAFRSCAEAVYHLGDARLRAATLVDATGPATRPAALPGAQPLPGHPGIVVASGRITARRAGNAWLVVSGTDPAARLRLLTRLRVHPPAR